MGKVWAPKTIYGGFNSPNIFQEYIYKLFKGFNVVHLYIYYLLAINIHNFIDYLKALENVL